MKKLFLLTPLLLTGCAHGQVSESRQAYILAHPHGWIELTINDRSVPADVPAPDQKNSGPTPPDCGISVDRFRENFLTDSVWPRGDQPPYIADTGFRFPVPSGKTTITITYAGCRIGKDHKLANISITLPVNISEGKVTPIQFDGGTATVEPEIENNTISNEDLARLIRGLGNATAK